LGQIAKFEILTFGRSVISIGRASPNCSDSVSPQALSRIAFKIQIMLHFWTFPGSEAAHHGSIRGSTEILEVISLKKAQQGLGWSATFGVVQKLSPKMGPANERQYTPHASSLWLTARISLSAHRREKRRMKKATRDLEDSGFNPNSMIPLNTRISLEEIESRSVTCLFR
jgi:hypothetical protein